MMYGTTLHCVLLDSGQQIIGKKSHVLSTSSCLKRSKDLCEITNYYVNTKIRMEVVRVRRYNDL